MTLLKIFIILTNGYNKSSSYGDFTGRKSVFTCRTVNTDWACGEHIRKETSYFYLNFTDFRPKHGIIAAFCLWKPEISCSAVRLGFVS